MDDLTINKTLLPKRVIIIYEDKKESIFYLENRDIEVVNEKMVFMAPVPLSDDVMQNISKSYVKSNTIDIGFDSIIPSHILHGSNKLGKTVVIWYRPAMKRSLNFSRQDLKKAANDVEVPATLYVVLNKDLYVFALMTNERPDRNTKLYGAPFFNIYHDGRVCLGTAPVGKIKAKTYSKEAERFERGFYLAEQSGGQSAANCKTPLDILWKDLIKNKRPFPSDKELVQHKQYKTLGDLLTKLIGNKEHE